MKGTGPAELSRPPAPAPAASGGGRLQTEPGRADVREQVASVGAKTRQQVEIARDVRGHADEHEVTRSRPQGRPAEDIPAEDEQHQTEKMAQTASRGDDRGPPRRRT